MENPIKLGRSIAGVAVIFVLAFNAQASEIPGTPSQKAEAALEAPKVEDRSAEWHLQNWPVDESHRQYNQHLQQNKNGKHIWRNGKGGIVAEIEIKDTQPFEGLTYIQGASDYRMVTRWKKGKGTLRWSYILKEEKWVVFQDHQRVVFQDRQRAAIDEANEVRADSQRLGKKDIMFQWDSVNKTLMNFLGDHGCPGHYRFTIEEIYVDGVLTTEKYLFKNGKPMAEIPFQDGFIHGSMKYWSEGGILLAEIPFSEGRIHGACRYFDREGKLLGISEFKQGTGTYKIWRTWGDRAVGRERQYINGVVVETISHPDPEKPQEAEQEDAGGNRR
jgi:hypothetical protein